MHIIHFMIMKKRGLSDVVTVTLIILLAVAAVVIVWAFVRSTIEEAGEDIKADCLKTNLKVISCGDGNILNGVEASPVIVESNAGGVNVDTVKLIYYDNTGLSDSRDTSGCDGLGPLDRKPCQPDTTPTNPVPAGYNKVDAAAVIDGEACTPTGVPVTCA